MLPLIASENTHRPGTVEPSERHLFPSTIFVEHSVPGTAFHLLSGLSGSPTKTVFPLGLTLPPMTK